MKCEKSVEKSGITSCNGGYCQPDGFDAVRIAQDFSTAELTKRLNNVKERLLEKPENCEIQHAFNQLKQAQSVKGVLN